jgi:hypothetical protein
VIAARDPYRLTAEIEPEFGMMLQYLQELNSRKKPNYKMLRSQFEVMKDRHHLRWNLEWFGGKDKNTFKSDLIKGGTLDRNSEN